MDGPLQKYMFFLPDWKSTTGKKETQTGQLKGFIIQKMYMGINKLYATICNC